MSALSSCPSDQHSKEVGDDVDGAGVWCLGDAVECVAWADASVMHPRGNMWSVPAGGAWLV